MDTLQHLSATIAARRDADPASSYVAALHAKGLDAILKKVAEESAEVIMAAKDGNSDHLVKEVADVWFHTLIALAQFDKGASDVLAELQRREGVSGHAEKAQRSRQ
jgi:phosphoribosyl-ATP pyrophosphohydrolase